MSEKRDKRIHIAFNESELEEIDKYRKESKTTRSNFIRQAIFEKIRRIENPEINIGNMENINDLMTQLLNGQKKQQEVNKLIMERATTGKDLKNSFNALKGLVKNANGKIKRMKIINLLKAHGSLRINKLIELSGFSKETIYELIADQEIFSINLKTGGIKLNE